MVMTNTDKGTNVNDVGETDPGKGMRPQRHNFFVVARRLFVFVLTLAVVLLISAALGIYIYDSASESNNEQWLVMLASVLGGAWIVQSGLDFLRKLLADIIATVQASLQRDPKPFRARLAGLREHAISLIFLVFALLVVTRHFINESGIPNFRELIKEQVIEALEDQEYTRERAVVLDLLPSLQDSFIYARIPIFFNVADLDPDHGDVIDSEDDFRDGVSYTDDMYEHKVSVEELVDRLKPCGTKDTPVRLRVEGYASSKPFQVSNDNERKESDRLNVIVANLRRNSVEEALQTKIDDEKLGQVVKLAKGKDYESIKEMKLFRRFNDRPSEDTTTSECSESDANSHRSCPQDLFTRSAHILILDLGKCKEPRQVLP